MVGTPVVAALLAHVCFWVLLAYGWFWQEIRLRGIVVFVVLWLAGFYGLSLAPNGGVMFPAYVAVLDIVLVLMIFRGDLALT